MYERSLSVIADGLGLTGDSAIYQLSGFRQIISSLRSCSLICKQRILILVIYLPEFLGRSNEIMATHSGDAITRSLNSFHFPCEHTASCREQVHMEGDVYYFPPDLPPATGRTLLALDWKEYSELNFLSPWDFLHWTGRCTRKETYWDLGVVCYCSESVLWNKVVYR